MPAIERRLCLTIGYQDLMILLAENIEATRWRADSLVKCASHRQFGDAILGYFPLEVIEQEKLPGQKEV